MNASIGRQNKEKIEPISMVSNSWKSYIGSKIVEACYLWTQKWSIKGNADTKDHRTTRGATTSRTTINQNGRQQSSNSQEVLETDPNWCYESSRQVSSTQSRWRRNQRKYGYLRMLIFIETQVEMHLTILKFKTRNGQSNITYIDTPKDTSIGWNEIPKILPQEEWERNRIPGNGGKINHQT